MVIQHKLDHRNYNFWTTSKPVKTFISLGQLSCAASDRRKPFLAFKQARLLNSDGQMYAVVTFD